MLSFKEQPAANRIAFRYRLNRIPHIPKRNTLQAFPVSFIQRYPNTNQVPPGFPGNRPWQITKNGNPENRISVRNKKERETGFEPATLALARRYSTTEPLAHNHFYLFKPFNLVSFADEVYYSTAET